MTLIKITIHKILPLKDHNILLSIIMCLITLHHIKHLNKTSLIIHHSTINLKQILQLIITSQVSINLNNNKNQLILSINKILLSLKFHLTNNSTISISVKQAVYIIKTLIFSMIKSLLSSKVIAVESTNINLSIKHKLQSIHLEIQTYPQSHPKIVSKSTTQSSITLEIKVKVSHQWMKISNN